MAADALTICNLALSEIGQDPQTTLVGASKTITLLNLFYPVLRDEVLVSQPWNFATKRATLSAGAAPNWEFARGFDLPADCLKALKVDTEAGVATLPWKVEGRQVVTDLSSPIRLLYIAQITDTTTFPPAYTMALVKRLAQELAEPIAQSAALADQLGGEYELLLHRARGINAAEGTPDRLALDVENIILAKIALARGDLDKDGTPLRGMLYDPARTLDLINAVYPAVRDEVLTAHPWNFALKRAVLTLGGMARATVVSGGTGGTPGAVTLTGTTGTGTKFQASGTIGGGGVLSGALTVTIAGDYTVLPADLTAEPVTGGGLIGATVALETVAAPAAWEFAHAYDRPADCLKAWRVETTTPGETLPWKVEGGGIVTNMTAPIRLLYIAQITDTGAFSPSFRMALVTRLAQEVARASPDGPDVADRIGKDYLALLTQARMIDTGEGTPDRYVLEIENLAIGKLGPKAQAVLVGPSNIAMLLSSLFPALRDEVMAAHPWNFALKRVTLTLGGMSAANVVDGGTGGTPGAVTLTGTTGAGTLFQATGTIGGGGVLAGALVVSVAGAYTTFPTDLTAEPVTGGGLTGATVALTRATTPPVWEFANAFDLPADCLRVWKVKTSDRFATRPWKVEGRQILTDLGAPLDIQYIARVTDTTRFQPAFTVTLATRIAQDLALPLVQDARLMAQLKTDYQDLLRAARSMDAQEGVPDRPRSDVLIDAMRSW